MKLFVNWLGRWARIGMLVEEHKTLRVKPFTNFTRLGQIEKEIGALFVTAIGPDGNSQVHGGSE